MLGREFLIKQKVCCGSGCFLCPYIPKHIAGSNKIDNKYKQDNDKENNMNSMGYACINMGLSNSKPRITTNRNMIKRTFLSKGVEYASELGLQNAKDLYKVIQWNIDNGFDFYRISSNCFPWSSEYDWDDLPDIDEIRHWSKLGGDLAREHGVRLTSHPGPFNVLTSPHPHVVDNCIVDLTLHGDHFDMMGLDHSPYNKLNIHIGGVYGDKESAMKRFCDNFPRLPIGVRSRLTVENDDKASMYSVKDLYDGVYKRIGIPIVFDYHHHRFNDGGLSEQEALELAMSTWPDDIVPVVHYSESRSIEQEDDKIRPQAHSDYVYDYINTYGNRVDIMVEAKAKELAVLKYKEIHDDTRTNSN